MYLVAGLISELKLSSDVGIIYTDSQSSLHLARNHVYHDRTKHVDVRFHFTRDKLNAGEIKIRKVNFEKNPGDMGTKFVPPVKFNHFLNLLRIS